MEPSTIVVVCGFFVLGILSALSWHEIGLDRRAARRFDEKRFLGEESRRQGLRTAGWFLLFFALMVRIFADSVAGDVVGTIMGAASVLSFLADGLLGRYYRRRWLGKG